MVNLVAAGLQCIHDRVDHGRLPRSRWPLNDGDVRGIERDLDRTPLTIRRLVIREELALDPARGGVGRDDYTACIVHYEGERIGLAVDRIADVVHAPLDRIDELPANFESIDGIIGGIIGN